MKFLCQLCQENYWHILPTEQRETWKLTEVDSRWILSVNDIPQLYLNHQEAIAFLALRARI
ncbi:hypothetical protein IQ255_05925 [Pleurocapsales cyanobacterium LEGE 10410]|nr:hypothetical protein [Pleurocapsales cyanobacterium LEGE 10410]